jgi:hypothetical protein
MSEKRDSQVQHVFPQIPAVFALRPTHYEPVTPDQVRVWEAAMWEKVGMRAAIPPGGGSWSVTGGEFGWDDCDLTAGPSRQEESCGQAQRTDEGRLRRQELPDQPVVFMFRPTSYVEVPSDRITEWEQTMAKRVGITPKNDPASLRRQVIATYGWCGRPDGDFDYCDSI